MVTPYIHPEYICVPETIIVQNRNAAAHSALFLCSVVQVYIVEVVVSYFGPVDYHPTPGLVKTVIIRYTAAPPFFIYDTVVLDRNILNSSND